jgi:hypothetical protein
MSIGPQPAVSALCVAVLALASSQCSSSSLPASPVATINSPAPAASESLSGFVVDVSGVCIAGATIEVVGGATNGAKTIQKTPCDAWSYSGGFAFTGVATDGSVKLRATAAGYGAAEVAVSGKSVMEIVLPAVS